MSGPRVVALGDSITLGVGDATVPRCAAGWAGLAAAALGASSFTNLAVNGARARDVLAHQVEAASACAPDLVLLTVGGNDVLRGDFSPEEVERCVGGVVERLGAPGRLVVAASLDRIRLFDLAPSRVAEAMARRIARANAALARAYVGRALVIDGATLLASQGRRAWHIDRIHPSPAGHRALAAAAVAAVAPHWTARAPLPPCPPPPGRAAAMAWLTVNGVPWAAKRSRDLLPQVAMVVARELAAERRGRVPRHPAAGTGPLGSDA